ncbi:MAG: hypothetical protein D6739_01310 [Nitrospirae bacterium]|nr:MAG: hypothetical protein D6739_01310 [Nitrospirota bacterium]
MGPDGCPPPAPAPAERDADGDGVPDAADRGPGTPAGVAVDAAGCPKDTDGDGVPDLRDRCPHTPAGVAVDAAGCPKDTDGDGVPDYRDQCPATPRAAEVDRRGCWVLHGVRFATGKAELDPASGAVLDAVVRVLKANPGLRLEVQGHTDSTGSARFNRILSQRRAEAVVDYLAAHGIDRGRLTAKGYGPSRPVASNATPEGRAANRRVELKPLR